jgi:hypothetical protein
MAQCRAEACLYEKQHDSGFSRRLRQGSLCDEGKSTHLTLPTVSPMMIGLVSEESCVFCQKPLLHPWERVGTRWRGGSWMQVRAERPAVRPS